jgi:hypothetical protein
MGTEEINTEDEKKALKTTKDTKGTELVNIKGGGNGVIQLLVNIFLYEIEKGTYLPRSGICRTWTR